MLTWDIFKWIRRPSPALKVEILRKSFTWPSAYRDICQACGKERVYHRRNSDCRFVEKEED